MSSLTRQQTIEVLAAFLMCRWDVGVQDPVHAGGLSTIIASGLTTKDLIELDTFINALLWRFDNLPSVTKSLNRENEVYIFVQERKQRQDKPKS